MSYSANSAGSSAPAVNTKMCVMTVFARYLSSSDNLAPTAGRMNNKSAENPANVIIRPANVYKRVAPLISMFCSRILCELPLQKTAVHQIPWQKSPQIIWKVTHTACDFGNYLALFFVRYFERSCQ